MGILDKYWYWRQHIVLSFVNWKHSSQTRTCIPISRRCPSFLRRQVRPPSPPPRSSRTPCPKEWPQRRPTRSYRLWCLKRTEQNSFNIAKRNNIKVLHWEYLRMYEQRQQTKHTKCRSKDHLEKIVKLCIYYGVQLSIIEGLMTGCCEERLGWNEQEHSQSNWTCNGWWSVEE